MCMNVCLQVCKYISVCLVLMEVKESIEPLELELQVAVTATWELGIKPSLLQKQQVLSPSEPSLKPLHFVV